MKNMTRVLEKLMWGALFLIGVALVVCMANDQYFERYFNGTDLRIVIGTISALFSALALFFFIRKMMDLDSGPSISFPTPDGGSGIISVRSIEHCLRNTLSNEGDVHRAAVRLKLRREEMKNSITCTAYITVDERVDLPSRTAEFSDIIRKRFFEMLPMEEDFTVTVQLRLSPEKKLKKKSVQEYEEKTVIPPYHSNFRFDPEQKK